MRAGAQEATSRTKIAAAASAETARSVALTLGATDELEKSLAEIDRQSANRLALSHASWSDAETSMAALRDLGQAAEQIGSVVEMISRSRGRPIAGAEATTRRRAPARPAAA
jgi:hypothetical protein